MLKSYKWMGGGGQSDGWKYLGAPILRRRKKQIKKTCGADKLIFSRCFKKRNSELATELNYLKTKNRELFKLCNFYKAQAQTQLPFTFIIHKFSDATSSASCLSVGETFLATLVALHFTPVSE